MELGRGKSVVRESRKRVSRGSDMWRNLSGSGLAATLQNYSLSTSLLFQAFLIGSQGNRGENVSEFLILLCQAYFCLSKESKLRMLEIEGTFIQHGESAG